MTSRAYAKNALVRLLDTDVRTNLCLYLRARDVRALEMASPSLREGARANDVWHLLAARDHPRARWSALWQLSAAAALSSRSAYCAATHSRQSPCQSCVLCCGALGMEEHVLLLCACLDLPQYLAVHARCAATSSATSATRLRGGTLGNSRSIQRRYFRDYTCPFCEKERKALVLPSIARRIKEEQKS